MRTIEENLKLMVARITGRCGIKVRELTLSREDFESLRGCYLRRGHMVGESEMTMATASGGLRVVPSDHVRDGQVSLVVKVPVEALEHHHV